MCYATRALLHKEIEKTGRKAKFVELPPEKMSTAESLAHLEREIAAQIEANRLMRARSYIEAEKTFC